jgi:hypothetical protein
MSALHEDLHRTEPVEGGSDRAFGLTVGGILLIIAAGRALSGGISWLEGSCAVAGLLLVGVGAIAPARLGPLNRLWTKLGVLLAKVVSPVGLGLIYVLGIVPTGLIIRLLGKDPLRLWFDPTTPDYWVRRVPPGPDPKTMNQQF